MTLLLIFDWLIQPAVDGFEEKRLSEFGEEKLKLKDTEFEILVIEGVANLELDEGVSELLEGDSVVVVDSVELVDDVVVVGSVEVVVVVVVVGSVDVVVVVVVGSVDVVVVVVVVGSAVVVAVVVVVVVGSVDVVVLELVVLSDVVELVVEEVGDTAGRQN